MTNKPPKLPLNPFRLDSMTARFIKGSRDGKTPLETIETWTQSEKWVFDREMDFIRTTFFDILCKFETELNQTVSSLEDGLKSLERPDPPKPGSIA